MQHLPPWWHLVAVKSGKPKPRPLSEIEFRAAELWFQRLPKSEICRRLKKEFGRKKLSRTTIYRWAELPGFQAALSQLRRERLEEAFRDIQELLPAAPAVVREIMEGKTTVLTPAGYRDITPAERLKAVEMVYSIAKWMHELDHGILADAGGAEALLGGTPEDALKRINDMGRERGLADVIPLWGVAE